MKKRDFVQGQIATYSAALDRNPIALGSLIAMSCRVLRVFIVTANILSHDAKQGVRLTNFRTTFNRKLCVSRCRYP